MSWSRNPLQLNTEMHFSNLISSLQRKRKFAKMSKKRIHLWALDKPQVCYIQNYKVATRSIRLALSRFLIEQETGQNQLEYEAISDAQVEEKDEATKRLMHINQIRAACPDHFIFTFVRHPLARIQSCYTNRLLDAAQAKDSERFSIYGIDRDTSFERFVEIIAEVPDKHADRHFRSQHLLVNEGDRTVCDFVGKFENLEDDWMQLKSRFSFPSLPHKNKSSKRPITDFALTQQSIRLVEQRYQKDYEIFGYE